MYLSLPKNPKDPIILYQQKPKSFASLPKPNQSTEDLEQQENKNDDFIVQDAIWNLRYQFPKNLADPIDQNSGVNQENHGCELFNPGIPNKNSGSQFTITNQNQKNQIFESGQSCQNHKIGDPKAQQKTQARSFRLYQKKQKIRNIPNVIQKSIKYCRHNFGLFKSQNQDFENFMLLKSVNRANLKILMKIDDPQIVSDFGRLFESKLLKRAIQQTRCSHRNIIRFMGKLRLLEKCFLEGCILSQENYKKVSNDMKKIKGDHNSLNS